MEEDLKKYRLSISIQENRKTEVHRILMNYKEELITNAETRKGTKIPQAQIDAWLYTEKNHEEEVILTEI